MARNIDTVSDWLNIFTKAFGFYTCRSLFILPKMATKQRTLLKAPTKPEITDKTIDNSAKGIRRRQLYKALKERKREDSFVNKYIQLKYPEIYDEIKVSYNLFAQKYPSRSDFTKTYFFKKWQKQINMEKSKLYVPCLPILTNKNQLEKKRETTTPQPSPQPSQPSPQPSQPSPQPSQSSSQSSQPSPQPSQPSPQPSQPSPQPSQPSPQPSQPSSQPSQPPPQTQIDPPFVGMSLGDMEIAAEEIIRSLQSDRDLMDIIENFEFPEPTWNPDFNVTDYVLETDQDW